MPQIIINNNGLDLEEIERMQNEKDESQRQDESGDLANDKRRNQENTSFS